MGFSLHGDSVVLHAADGSRSEVSPDGEVSWSGPHDLWRIMETRYDTWHALGSPGWDRFGLTVTADRQWVWLDDPAGAHTVDLDR